MLVNVQGVCSYSTICTTVTTTTTTMTTTKQAILKAALPRVRAHSFTLTAIRGGITDHPEAGSKDPERLVDDIFGSKGEAEKELVRYWEEEGIRRMSDRGRGGQGETLRDVLGRRLGFSEESAGEGVVQVRLNSTSCLAHSVFPYDHAN